MEILPPALKFHLKAQEAIDIVELRKLEIDSDSLIRQSRGTRWKHPTSLVKHAKGTYKLYPHLADILELCKIKSEPLRSSLDGVPPHNDALKYKLLGDFYREGLYDPTPSNHRLHGLLDFFYFPEQVKAEAGEEFPDLIRLWELMALTVDDTLYRHSTTAYALYAPLWEDIHLRFTVGFKLIKIATYYGDYDLAEKYLTFLTKQRKFLNKESDFDFYTDNIERLTLNSQAHYHDGNACLDDLHSYRSLYERVCARSITVAEGERQRHLELIRAICRGACRFGVRYVMRVLANDGHIGPRALGDVSYLAKEYASPSLNQRWSNHRDLRFTNHDWDTVSRAWAVVLAEHDRSLGDIHLVDRSLIDAETFQEKASKENVKRRNQDYRFLEEVLEQPKLARWTSGVDKGKVQKHAGSLYDFWETLSYAMLKVQFGRHERLSRSGTGKQHYLEAREVLQRLAIKRHSPKLRHSGYLLASVHQLLELELAIIDQIGKAADGNK